MGELGVDYNTIETAALREARGEDLAGWSQHARRACCNRPDLRRFAAGMARENKRFALAKRIEGWR